MESIEFGKKEEHHKLMTSSGCDIDRLIAFRHDIHQHAELGFQELRTSAKVREMLLSFGLEE